MPLSKQAKADQVESVKQLLSQSKLTVAAFYHVRAQTDPAMAWFRTRLNDVANA